MRNRVRALLTYTRAFADHHFHESEDVFLAALRDDCLEIRELAIQFRGELIAKTEIQERRMQSPRDE